VKVEVAVLAGHHFAQIEAEILASSRLDEEAQSPAWRASGLSTYRNEANAGMMRLVAADDSVRPGHSRPARCLLLRRPAWAVAAVDGPASHARAAQKPGLVPAMRLAAR
jgi:hypothetical protein